MARDRKREAYDADNWFVLNGKIVEPGPYVPPTVDVPDSPRDALPGLIRFAIKVWDEISWVFGGSRKLVERRYISKKEHSRIGDWVRNLELLVRRIIIIAAASLELAPVKSNPRPWGPGRHRRALWHDPSSWHVSFRVLLPEHANRSRRRRTMNPPKKTQPAWRMAWRIEALRRVLSYPAGAALRLARTLQRIKAANARANEPRRIALPGRWDFHPAHRTLGKHAAKDGMMLAIPLSDIQWALYWDPG